jgi:uncharacterized protein (DUF58 family)
MSKSASHARQPQWLNPAEMARLSSLELRARDVVEGFLQGLHRSPFVGYSVEFSSHRRYGAGDDLRHVNWKIFARQRRLYVKEFDAETNMNLYLFVDSSRSMQCQVDGLLTKYEYSSVLAAAMASLALKQRDGVAIGRMDDGITQYLDPSARPGRWDECIQMLSAVPSHRMTRLGRSLEQAASLARHKGVVAIFSDLVDEIDAVRNGLQQLRHRGHEVILFHVLDPCERTFPDSGRFKIVDMEEDRQVTTNAESIQRQYQARVDQWCADLRDLCLHQGVDRIEVTTDQPPAETLINYLVRKNAL